jgi:hypothetical protein
VTTFANNNNQRLTVFGFIASVMQRAESMGVYHFHFPAFKVQISVRHMAENLSGSG